MYCNFRGRSLETMNLSCSEVCRLRRCLCTVPGTHPAAATAHLTLWNVSCRVYLNGHARYYDQSRILRCRRLPASFDVTLHRHKPTRFPYPLLAVGSFGYILRTIVTQFACPPSSFVSQVTGEKSVAGDYVLVPFVDSMNHVTTAKTELSFSPVSGDLRVSVNRCVPTTSGVGV